MISDISPTVPTNADPTLDLPRILCLHGGGTNANIFRQQCRVLTHHLLPNFRLVFANAPFPCSKPGPDVTSVYAKKGPFRTWLPMFEDEMMGMRNPRDVIEGIGGALQEAMWEDDLRGATGEWAALLGFSQGAKVAASLLFAQQRRVHNFDHTMNIPRFRFAVLLAGRGPLVWLDSESNTVVPVGFVSASTLSTLLPSYSSSSLRDHRLQVPTIHVHGLGDPGIETHRALLRRYCDGRSATLIEWDGGHRIPIKTKDVMNIVRQILNMARRTGV